MGEWRRLTNPGSGRLDPWPKAEDADPETYAQWYGPCRQENGAIETLDSVSKYSLLFGFWTFCSGPSVSGGLDPDADSQRVDIRVTAISVA
jgi:hypothetical protein